jgi:hypothetical protein
MNSRYADNRLGEYFGLTYPTILFKNPFVINDLDY